MLQLGVGQLRIIQPDCNPIGGPFGATNQVRGKIRHRHLPEVILTGSSDLSGVRSPERLALAIVASPGSARVGQARMACQLSHTTRHSRRSEGSTMGQTNPYAAPLVTWRMNAYRLIVGAIVLAIVIPAWAVGVQAMWLIAFACIFVVVCAVCTSCATARPIEVTG